MPPLFLTAPRQYAMPAIKFTRCKENSFLSMDLHNDRIQFDYPAEIYGKNHRIGDKPILIKVKPVNAKKIFISSNNALGIFFMKKNVPIYITRPVYEQLVLRLRELQGYLVNYDDEHDKTDLRSVNDANITKAERNIIFITYNEITYFDTFMVEAVSSNTFLGWSNFILHVQNRKLAYVSTFSLKGRISFKMEPTKLHVIIYNQRQINTHGHNLDDFLRICQDDMIKIIPIDMSSMFLELFLFLLNTTRDMNIRICVVSSIYTAINRIVNGCGKWLNKKFRIEQHDPLPLIIKNVTYCDDLAGVNELDDDSIVFCTKEEFDVTNNSIDNGAYYGEMIGVLNKENGESTNGEKAQVTRAKVLNKENGKSTNGEKAQVTRAKEAVVDEDSPEDDVRIKRINTALGGADKNERIDFIIRSILKGDTTRAKGLFNRKYSVLNVMGYDMVSDYSFDLNLNSTVPEMRTFYGDPVIISNSGNGLKENDIAVTDEEVYVINVPNVDYYTYSIKNAERMSAGDNLLLFDGKIRNERLACTRNRLKRMFRETYYLYDGQYFFPGLRKKVWFDNDVFYIEDY
ncbi:hypothetical protein THOM_1592 [Trachipleistophora hominis]|uniref:Uncharacterized protein n=1 Tax=Trachipleistophora hominis TaxID=72359 RepID=L7JWL7_TRAHO|nr:hypothetical protein THOM_1592 [Trachipleistophora hominis]